MTGYGLAASLAWSAVAGYAAWRADLLVAKALALRSTEHADAVRVKTAQVESAERIALTRAERVNAAALTQRTVSSVALPDDLEAVAMLESEEWARDNQRVLMREQFLELNTGDDVEAWQKVRRAVGVAEMP